MVEKKWKIFFLAGNRDDIAKISRSRSRSVQSTVYLHPGRILNGCDTFDPYKVITGKQASFTILPAKHHCMKLFAFFLISMICFCFSPFVQAYGCTSKVQNITDGTGNKCASEEATIYFKAIGDDPVWNLTISSEQVVFQTHYFGTDKFIFPHAEPVRVAETQTKKYSLQSGEAQIIIELDEKICQNTSSRERFTYGVIISIRRIADSTFTDFFGCGHYITDKNLESTWVLNQIISDTVSAADFNDTLPYLVLHAFGNSFKGFGGCNTIDGRIFSERQLLRFTNLVLSKRTCGPGNKEQEFIRALQFSTHFAIEDNRLILSNPGGVMLIFARSGSS